MGRTPRGQTRERVFAFVRERLLAGDPPTVREVQEVFGFRTPQTARYHLEQLVAEGRLMVERGKARGYRLLESLQGPEASLAGGPVVWAPLLGRVQAGALTAAIADPEGYVPVQNRSASEELFALRVRGKSMIGAGIFPEDIVIVRRQPTADSGEIVVALVEEEATVKRLRLRRRSGRQQIELHPENPDFDPILPDRDVTLLGKVVEVRRALQG